MSVLPSPFPYVMLAHSGRLPYLPVSPTSSRGSHTAPALLACPGWDEEPALVLLCLHSPLLPSMLGLGA